MLPSECQASRSVCPVRPIAAAVEGFQRDLRCVIQFRFCSYRITDSTPNVISNGRLAQVADLSDRLVFLLQEPVRSGPAHLVTDCHGRRRPGEHGGQVLR